jgi:hypothetical protein
MRTPTECDICDDYQLVRDPATGMLETCICRAAAERCRVHGRTLRNGRCGSCSSEAQLAEEIVSNHSPAGHPLVGAR